MSRDKGQFITSPKAGAKNAVEVREDLPFTTVILLSENHGHRMKSYGPVSMLKIGAETLLEKQVKAIKSVLKNFEIILCCGFETFKTVSYVKTRFPNLNIRVVENQIHYNSNCAESARLCLNNTMNSRILFCNGGILLKADQLAAVDFTKTNVVTQENNDSANLEVGVIENNHYLENLSFGIKNRYWCEIFYLNSIAHVQEFYGIVSNPDYKSKFMFEAINDFTRRYPVGVVTANKVTRIDNIKTIKGMNQ